MNPRHRRLILPGLLIVLLIVVVVASLTGRSDAAERAASGEVSVLSDPRITESSGLAVSPRHADLAYTVNDSGNAPLVFAVRISTGKTIATTRLTGYRFRDIEALAIDGDGRLWVADTGDNNGVRDDAALYVLDEPGTQGGSVKPTRYRVAYQDGPQDVEALAIDPRSGSAYLISKGFVRGELYPLPPVLSTTAVNTLAPTSDAFPLLVTDASFSPDGKTFVVRTYVAAAVYDAATFEKVGTLPLPLQKQGETIAFESSGRSVLIGSEGVRSTLQRVAVTGAPTSAPTATPAADAVGSGKAPENLTAVDGGVDRGWIVGGVVVAGCAAALLLASAFVRPRRRGRERSVDRPRGGQRASR